MRRQPHEYQFRQLAFGRSVPTEEAREQLTEEAEYGRWELARTRVRQDGQRTVWLRRRIIRPGRTP